MSATTEGVTALLAKYNEALNASSADAVMPLYTEDGVFMPPYS
jgi:ketosteroid isomerase-like protein